MHLHKYGCFYRNILFAFCLFGYFELKLSHGMHCCAAYFYHLTMSLVDFPS